MNAVSTLRVRALMLSSQHRLASAKPKNKIRTFLTSWLHFFLIKIKREFEERLRYKRESAGFGERRKDKKREGEKGEKN